MYPTLDTSRIRTARVKLSEEADTGIITREILINLEERNVGTKRKSRKQGLTSSKDLTIFLV